MNVVLFVKTFPKISETFIVNQVKHIKANVICQIEGEFEIDDYKDEEIFIICLLYTSPSPRDRTRSRMPSSA